MTDHEMQLRNMAVLAIENGECGAQVEIRDEFLREALTEAILMQLRKAYQLAAAE